MSSNSNPCVAFCTVKPVAECIETINLGEVTATTGEVTIYVRYTLGGNTITHQQDYGQSGYTADIILDTTAPSKDYYNSFNGLYLVWVTDKGDNIDQRLTMTIGTKEATTWAFTFVKTNTSTLDVTLSPSDD